MDFMMQVVPEPPEGTGNVILPEKPFEPTIRGDGLQNYLCGKCKKIICETVQIEQIKDAIVKCGYCGVFNVISR